jgi:hypothetical protein
MVVCAGEVQSYFLDGVGQYAGSNSYMAGNWRIDMDDGIAPEYRAGDYSAIDLDENGIAYAASMEGQKYDYNVDLNWGKQKPDVCL